MSTIIHYDSEFYEDGPGKPIIAISIGMVAEDGQEFYGEYAHSAFDAAEREWLESLPDWHRENILPHLEHYNRRCDCTFSPITGDIRDRGMTCPRRDYEEMRQAIRAFVDFAAEGKPEWWGYFCGYDHVILCQTFGRMIDLPQGWPMMTRDIKQLADQIIGSERLPKPEREEHNALADARWNRWAFLYLDATMRGDQHARSRIADFMRRVGRP